MQETFSGGDACRQDGAHCYGPHGGIFLRAFLGFLALTLATVLFFTVVLAATVLQAGAPGRLRKRGARCRRSEVAEYMSHLNQLQLACATSSHHAAICVLAQDRRPSTTSTTPTSGSSATIPAASSRFWTAAGNIVRKPLQRFGAWRSWPSSSPGSGGAREGPVPRAGRADRDHRRALALQRTARWWAAVLLQHLHGPACSVRLIDVLPQILPVARACR